MKEQNRITRRDFHRLVVAGAGSVVLGLGKEATDLLSPVPDTNREFISIVLPMARTPLPLVGIGFNAPGFKDFEGATFYQAITSLDILGATAIRDMLGNEIEPVRVGDFSVEPLRKVLEKANTLYLSNPPVHYELDLMDFFPLFWEKHYLAVNPLSKMPASIADSMEPMEKQKDIVVDPSSVCLYPPEKKPSPYMEFLDPDKIDQENWREFLRNPLARKAVRNRIEFILTTTVDGETIGRHPNITYFSFNEPPDVPEVTLWAEEMCDMVRNLSGKPVGVGMRRLGEHFWEQNQTSDMLGLHFYPESFPRMPGFYKRAFSSSVPVRLEETGLPLPIVRYQKLSERDGDSVHPQGGYFLQDMLLSSYYTSLFNTFIPHYQDTYYPSILSWRIWRLGGYLPECNFDHFNINPADMPQTVETIRRISGFLFQAREKLLLN